MNIYSLSSNALTISIIANYFLIPYHESYIKHIPAININRRYEMADEEVTVKQEMKNPYMSHRNGNWVIVLS